MSKVIGIDLGTTNSCVAVWKAEKRKLFLIQKETGQRLPLLDLKDGERQ